MYVFAASIVLLLIFATYDYFKAKEKEKEQTLIGLFLDDERQPQDVTWIVYPDNIQWTIVRTYQELVEYLELQGIPDVCSFDHDLQDFNMELEKKEYTGYDCLKHLCEVLADDTKKYPKIPEMFWHTNNIIGKENMKAYYDNFKVYHVLAKNK